MAAELDRLRFQYESGRFMPAVSCEVTLDGDDRAVYRLEWSKAWMAKNPHCGPLMEAEARGLSARWIEGGRDYSLITRDYTERELRKRERRLLASAKQVRMFANPS